MHFMTPHHSPFPLVALCLCLAAGCERADPGVSEEPATVTAVPQEPVTDLRGPPIDLEPAETIPEPDPMAALGSFKMTYYWVATEPKRSQGTQPIFDKTCKPVARVTKSFRRRLRLEGSGKLKDGRTIKNEGGCQRGGT